MRYIQQLIFNGKRLICPDHPDQQLDEGITASEEGPFAVVCTAKVGPANCMKSAQWLSRDAYKKALRELQENPD